MKCTFCGGVWHEATGHWYSKTARACGPCTRDFFKWLKAHVNRWANPKRPNFYEAAFKYAPSDRQR